MVSTIEPAGDAVLGLVLLRGADLQVVGVWAGEVGDGPAVEVADRVQLGEEAIVVALPNFFVLRGTIPRPPKAAWESGLAVFAPSIAETRCISARGGVGAAGGPAVALPGTFLPFK